MTDTPPAGRFASTATEVAWRGSLITAGVEHFRFEDGVEVTREKVWHPGAVGILAVDARHVWLIRQPREAADLTSSLEIPAGKRDVAGEPPLETAKRELAEEIGKAAAEWAQISVFFSSPGFTDERVWLYLATELSDDPSGHPDEDERIEIVPWPLTALDAAFAECVDSKSLVAIGWLKAQLASGGLRV